jgi:hypothetical protein
METTSLTNFNVPLPVRSRFDAICHASGRTRTSVLVDLMTDYILNQSQQLATRNHRFQIVDQMLVDKRASNDDGLLPSSPSALSQNRNQKLSNQCFELPDAFVSDGQEDW